MTDNEAALDERPRSGVEYTYDVRSKHTTSFPSVLWLPSSEGSPDGYKPCLSVGSAQVGPLAIASVNAPRLTTGGVLGRGFRGNGAGAAYVWSN